jgi:hypothetical protein
VVFPSFLVCIAARLPDSPPDVAKNAETGVVEDSTDRVQAIMWRTFFISPFNDAIGRIF